jgi:hypothetical protein
MIRKGVVRVGARSRTMGKYKAAGIAALAGLIVFAAGAVAGLGMFGASDEPAAVQLPSACDNFLAASSLFAQHGASAAIPGGGGDPLASGAEAQAYETLRGLLESCDDELALRVK